MLCYYICSSCHYCHHVMFILFNCLLCIIFDDNDLYTIGSAYVVYEMVGCRNSYGP